VTCLLVCRIGLVIDISHLAVFFKMAVVRDFYIRKLLAACGLGDQFCVDVPNTVEKDNSLWSYPDFSIFKMAAVCRGGFSNS